MLIKLFLITLSLFLSIFAYPSSEVDAKKDFSSNKLASDQENQMHNTSPEPKVFLDFRGTDIKDVARVLSKISGVSIIVADDVRAKVTLNIEDLTWITALQLILKANNLYYIEKDNVIMILTYQRIKREEEDAPLETRIITLNFVDIRQAKNYLSAIKSTRGNIEGDLRTNSLIITDTPEAIERIVKIVNKLDKKTPQVLIEVIMVDRKIVDDFDLGIEWTVEQESGFTRKAEQSFQSVGDLTLQYGKALDNMITADSVLKLLRQNSTTSVLANPRVITLDNIPAEINITDQVPYVSESTNADGNVITTTKFKEVGIKLNVKPHITPDAHIIMDITTEQSFVDHFITSGGTTTGAEQPVIGTRLSVNTMLVKDRETIIIGGLRKREKKETVNKVPLLGDIPLIKALFRRQSRDDEIRELMIFVTPRIVNRAKLAKEEEDNLLDSKDLLSTTSLLKEKRRKSKLYTADQIKPIITEEKKMASKESGICEIAPKIVHSKRPEKMKTVPDFRKLELMPIKPPNEYH